MMARLLRRFPPSRHADALSLRAYHNGDVFTGIVEALGRVRSLESGRLTLETEVGAWPDELRAGESIAVNGCCLTLIQPSNLLKFDLSPETLARTSLGKVAKGSVVNLERAM